MKKTLIIAAALITLPVAAQAQTPSQGFYVGAEGGANWLLNTTISVPGLGGVANVYPNTGLAAGGVIGYDFVGPRVELEGIYRSNTSTVNFSPIGAPNASFTAASNQIGVLANLLYDFATGTVLTPYIGAGAGVGFIDNYSFGSRSSSTQFAYQGIIGVGWSVSDQFRVNLDGRYYGTTRPTDANAGGASYENNNFSVMLGVQLKFGAPARPFTR